MPRRISIEVPAIPTNGRIIVRFDDRTLIRIKRDINGYHAKGGRAMFNCETKQDLDFRISLLSEDRGGIESFRDNDGVLTYPAPT